MIFRCRACGEEEEMFYQCGICEKCEVCCQCGNNNDEDESEKEFHIDVAKELGKILR